MAIASIAKKVTPYLDDVAGVATKQGDDLAKLHRRLSQYDNAASRITPEIMQKHPELGSKFANLTRRLGNEASLKMPFTNATHPTSATALPSEALRAGLGGNLAGIFEDGSKLVKNPNIVKNGDEAVDYIFDRNLPALKYINILEGTHSNAGYVPDNALQGIESLTPPDTLADFFESASRRGSDFDIEDNPIVSKHMFRGYSPYDEDSVLFPDGFGNPDDFARYYDSLELGYVPDRFIRDSKRYYETQYPVELGDGFIYETPTSLPRSISKKPPHIKQTPNQVFSTPMFEDDWWL